jgi:hypothetical protein
MVPTVFVILTLAVLYWFPIRWCGVGRGPRTHARANAGTKRSNGTMRGGRPKRSRSCIRTHSLRPSPGQQAIGAQGV